MRLVRGLSTGLRCNSQHSLLWWCGCRRAKAQARRGADETDATYPLVGGLFVTQREICRHSLLVTLFFLLPRPGA